MTNVQTIARPIPVLEIFGPTIQGEGLSIGRKTMFVRTAGCDYRCSWCDSAFTWDGSGKQEIRMLSPDAIWEELAGLGNGQVSHVVLSGGNPLLLPQLAGLVRLLRAKGVRTAVETQGSVWQDWVLETDEVTLSPKPPSSGMDPELAQLDRWISELAPSEGVKAAAERCASPKPAVSLKIVIFDEQDLDYAAGLHARYPQVPLVLQTGNREVTGGSAGDTAVRLLAAYEQLIGQVIARSDLADVRVLPQLHTLVWGNKRGV